MIVKNISVVIFIDLHIFSISEYENEYIDVRMYCDGEKHISKLSRIYTKVFFGMLPRIYN